jgi:hypothetical protein
MRATVTVPNERANEFEIHLNEQFCASELNDMNLIIKEKDFYTNFIFELEPEEADELEAMAEFYQ